MTYDVMDVVVNIPLHLIMVGIRGTSVNSQLVEQQLPLYNGYTIDVK